MSFQWRTITIAFIVKDLVIVVMVLAGLPESLGRLNLGPTARMPGAISGVS
jgi:hypothetical protein